MKLRKKGLAMVLSLAMVVMGFQILPQMGVKTRATSTAVATVRNPRINQGDSGDITVWDCIYFGKYWQNDTNGNGKADSNDEKEPIKWRVLSVDGNDALVLADQGLFTSKFGSNGTWSSSIIRSWLRNSFYNGAFNNDEKSAIIETNVNTYDFNSTTSYITTADNLFLLSYEEATNSNYGFSDNVYKECRRYMLATAYAVTNGAWGNTSNMSPDDPGYNCSGWWLRDYGYAKSQTKNIEPSGSISEYSAASYGYYCVRPAMHVNLSSSSVRYAGVVQCHGELLETATEEPEPVTYSGNLISINEITVAGIATGGTYTMPTSGTNYCELGYVDADNPENIYRPGTEITVTGAVNLITADRLIVANNTSGASIRMDKSAPAMAFAATASFNGGAPLLNDSLTYGMLLTTNDYYTELYDGELTLDSEDTYGGTVHNVTFDQGEWISESNGMFAAGIMNIAKANMSRRFLARAYVEVTYTDNTSAIIYSENTSSIRSLKDVAINIKKNQNYYNTLTESQKEAVDYFASVV